MTPRLTGLRRSTPPETPLLEAHIHKACVVETHVPRKLHDSSPSEAAPSAAPVFQLMPGVIDTFVTAAVPLLQASSMRAMASLLDAMELRLHEHSTDLEFRLHEHSNAIEQSLLEYFGESRMKWSEWQAMMLDALCERVPAQAANRAKPEGETSQALEARPAPAPAPAECGCSARVMDALQELKDLAINATLRAEHTRVETPIGSDMSRLTVDRQKNSQQDSRIAGRTTSRPASSVRDKVVSLSIAMASRNPTDSATTDVWDCDRVRDADTDSEEYSNSEDTDKSKRGFSKRAMRWMGHKLKGLSRDSLAIQISASAWFRVVSLMVTFVNCVVLAIDVSDNTDKTLLLLQGVAVQRSQTMVNGMQGFQIGFVVWMTFELAVRIYASGARYFCTREAVWNFMDLFVLVISIIDLFFTTLNFSFLQVLRILKGLKIVQAVRFIHYNFALRRMTSMMWHVATTCLWAMLLLFLFLYIVGLIMMTGVTIWAPSAVDQERRLDLVGRDYTVSTAFALHQSTVIEDLHSHYGSLERTLLTLLRAISGADWGAFAAPLAKINWFLGFVWVVYILVVCVGFFQFSTAIVVDQFRKPSAIEGTVRQLYEAKEANELRRVISNELAKCGRDDTSQLSSNFINKLILRENVSKQLRTVGINIDSHAHKDWFKAIDKEDKGWVLAPDLVRALFRLRGKASSLDVNMLRSELRHVDVALDALFDVVIEVKEKLEDMGMPSSV